MISGLQPSRPKPPQQSAQPTYAHQQRRAVHEGVQYLPPSPPQATAHQAGPTRPRSQIEAMPPQDAPHAATPLYTPPHPFYDSAIRHPVFFTQNLKKPPFPIPQIASQGWSPVANGYIMEQQRVLNAEARTKL
ncbi:hypothetical protein CC86DRAFT_318452 [Ophiobolus disseminans]|uniref:Uncharacterized protein n=1 Tax=Ophiobolus disseminans TaxID=1469910 RepID=A0A6A7A7I9_9PLEO|nr:hypothetical protein CC86DRAFT_318452 [Ophiobolus disseminans]